MAAQYLQAPDTITVDCEGVSVDVEGETVTLDADLAGQVATYVAHVRSLGGQRLVEVRSNYAEPLGLGEEEAWGTADAVVIGARTLYVIDLKTGRKWVSAVGNTQLLLYATGVVSTLNAVGMLDEIERIELHIVQPAVKDAPEVWSMDVPEFEARMLSLYNAAQRAAQAAQAFTGLEDTSWVKDHLRPEEEACQWCPAAALCPALEALTQGADVRYELAPSVDAINAAMARIPLIEAWIEAIQSYANALAVAGDPNLAYKLVLGRQGNRTWTDEAEAREVLLTALPLTKLVTEPKLKTPAQIEKLLPKGDKELLTDITKRAPAKPTLVPRDDPRPQWVENTADDFEVLT